MVAAMEPIRITLFSHEPVHERGLLQFILIHKLEGPGHATTACSVPPAAKALGNLE
jgi:hypothetical protein